jgi:hypothetical protein
VVYLPHVGEIIEVAILRGMCSIGLRDRLEKALATSLDIDISVATCSVPECGKRTVARGWCQTHYQRWQRTGSIEPRVLNKPESCLRVGCHKPPARRGLCRAHYVSSKRRDEPPPPKLELRPRT